MATQTMDEKLDDILEIVTFIRDSSIHKDDFNKHVKKTDAQMTEIKKDITGLKTDVADLKEDANHIKNHVKCLRFAVEKSVEILGDKKIYNEKEQQIIMEQFAGATI